MMRFFECLRGRGFATALLAFLLAAASLTAACSNPEKAKAEHVARGEAFLKEKKFQEAALEFRNAIQIDENLAPAHWGLAQAYEGLERFNETFEELTRTIKLDPNHKEARFKLGTYLLLGSQRNGQVVRADLLEEASRHAEELIRQDEKFIPGYILRANVLAVSGKRKEAEAEINRAISLDPSRIESYVSLANFYWSGGDAAKAEETFRRAMQINERASLVYVEYGKYLVQQGRTADAEAQFRKAAEVDPQNRDVQWVLASFYLVNGRHDRAEEVYKALAELDRDRPDGRAKLADFYASVGRLDDALNIYRETARQFPEYVRASYRIGELLLQKGDTAGAVAQADAILKTDARNLEALLLRARLRLEKNDVKGAIADLKQILDQEPRSQMALYFMSEAQFKDGQVEQARAFAADLERFHPDFLPAKLMQVQISLASGDAETARKQATELLEKLKTTAPGAQQTPQLLAEIAVRTHTARGTAYIQLYAAARDKNPREAAQHIAAARADMDAARTVWPNAPSSYTNLASVALVEGKLDEAMQHYERALSIDRTNFQALEGLIKLYGAMGRPADARARLDALVSENPQSAQLRYLKAAAYAQGNQASPADPAIAEAEFARAAELDREFIPAYQRLAELYFNTNRPDRAVDEYRKIIAIRKGANLEPPAMIYTHIGMVEYSRQNYEAAAESYRQALALNPNDDVAANNLAMLYADSGQGNIDEAVRLAQEIVRRNPQEPGFADTLGWVYYKKGVYGAAAEQLQKAVSLSAARGADNSTYRYHLGLALKDKGDRAAARRELQAALRLSETEAAQRGRAATPAEEIQRAMESL